MSAGREQGTTCRTTGLYTAIAASKQGMLAAWPPYHCCLLQKDEFLRLVINSVRNDLISRNEAFQCLALDFIANGGCQADVAQENYESWAELHQQRLQPGWLGLALRRTGCSC